MATPVSQAGQAGLIGTAAAVAGSGQVNQLLGTHNDSFIFQGNRILLPEYMYSPTTNPWNAPLITFDIDQPFTMSGTTLGRVQFPILAVGNGADLLVSLCADNSGTPGTMIVQTRIPASWINALSAVNAITGPATSFPITQLTGSPLAVSQFQAWTFANQVVLPYNFPAVQFSGASAQPSTSWYGGCIVVIGGVSNSAALPGVHIIPYDSSAILQPSVPQPNFPVTNDGSSATVIAVDSVTGGPIVVNTGGGTTYLGAATANVYTASLTTSTNQLSGWALQTSLPATVQEHTMATWNGYVYSIGGQNAGGLLNTVNYAKVQNGQITGWTAATPLPQALKLMFTVAVNGYLVVTGGADLALTAYSSTYYAVINANGSLGPWLPGPPLHTGTYDLNNNLFANSQGIITSIGVNTLVFGTSGPSNKWDQDLVGGSGTLPGYFDFGTGQVLGYALAPAGNQYGTVYFNLTPYLSVPLPATGLTNSATYHVLLQQQGGNQANYLFTSVMSNTYSGSGPTALTSSPGAYTWTAQQTGAAVAVQAWDQTITGPRWHSWEDSGANISTFVYATTSDQRLMGLAEATRINLQLNKNSGFESGTSPWGISAAQGTIARSNAQAFEGTYSMLVTPSGTAASVVPQSENMATIPGQSITVSGWFWFTNAVTTNFSLTVFWYTLAGSFISSSSALVSASATTWTLVTNTFTAPATAYQFSINPTLSGTPAASQLWYVDQVYATNPVTAQVSSAVEVTYPGTYPSGTFPPTGIQVIA